jgi:hypothetical protein
MRFFFSAPIVLALLVSQMSMGLVSGLDPSFSTPLPGCAVSLISFSAIKLVFFNPSLTGDMFQVGCLDEAQEGDLCVDPLVQENVSNCVVSACTIPDALGQ